MEQDKGVHCFVKKEKGKKEKTIAAINLVFYRR